MGRELKRVRMDFNWPIGKIWHGYINPYYKKHATECPHCEGSGSSPEVKHMEDQWWGYVPFDPAEKGSIPYTIFHPSVRAFAERNVSRTPEFYGHGEMAIQREAQRLCDEAFNKGWKNHLSQDDVNAIWADRGFEHTHDYCHKEKRWKPKEGATCPTAKEINDHYILDWRTPNAWPAMKALAKKNGWRLTCRHCKDGTIWDSPEGHKLYRRWKKFDPPKGPGYQLWGTTNEGEPLSPVFATLEELCEWAEVNETTFADNRASKQHWMDMLSDGLVFHQEGNMVFV